MNRCALLIPLLALLVTPTVLAADPPTLGSLRNTLKISQNEARRLEALQELVKLELGEAVTEERVAEALSVGLHDKAAAVRVEAARRLGNARFGEHARHLLVARLESSTETMKSKNKKIWKLRRKASKASTRGILGRKNRKLPRDPGKAVAELERQLKEFDKGQKEADRYQARIDREMEKLSTEFALAGEIGRSLARIPDEAGFVAYQEYFELVHSSDPRETPALTPGMLAFGTRQALAVVVDALADYQKTVERRRESEKRHEEFRRRMKELGSDVPESQEPTPKELWGERIHEQLVAYARKRELPAPPAWDEDEFVDEIREWQQDVADRLPESVPTDH